MEDLWGEYSALWANSNSARNNPTRRQLATEAYPNAVAYACINLKATSVDELDFLLRYEKGGKTVEIREHPILDLLRHPSKDRTSPDAINSVYYNAVNSMALYGEMFVHGVWVGNNEQPTELWSLPADSVDVYPGNVIGSYSHFLYNNGISSTRLSPAELLYHKRWNPLDPWRGYSPQSPCWGFIKVFNKAVIWMKSLLDHSARPSLAIFAPNGLDEKVSTRLKKELRDNYQGAVNAGRPMFLEGQVDAKEFGYAPNQMQYNTVIDGAAGYIATCNDTPLELIGEIVRKTYNNVFEARLQYHLKGVFPAANRLVQPFNHWLVPLYPDLRKLKAKLGFDRDSNEALEEIRDRRARRLERLRMSGVLTADEVRRDMGWPELNTEESQKLYVARQVVELSDTITSGDIEEAVGGSAVQGTQKSVLQVPLESGKTIEVPLSVAKLIWALNIDDRSDERSWKEAVLVDSFGENDNG
jgi:HK97 family phage portal protein